MSLSYKKPLNETSSISISGSKSETNRLLILQAIYPDITIKNASDSDDTKVLQEALKSSEKIINIGHAGTAMRFLTAYFASQEGMSVCLTGSHRMLQRPISHLVDALRELGADISYLKKEGFPPLQISGKRLSKSSVSVRADISSQYISALMLIAPSLQNGLKIHLEEKITSIPYIEMTLKILQQIGVSCSFLKNLIEIKSLENNHKSEHIVESDWSSISYFYSLVALSKDLNITLKNFKEKSLQGDSKIAEIYKLFGVETLYNRVGESITISKANKEISSSIQLDLNNNPDLAQTIAITSFALGLPCCLTGLSTLKIKETDRLLALKTELEKLGAKVLITEDSLKLLPSEMCNINVSINTYQDHRMAMAFAPLALKCPIQIKEAEVVSKSFPNFWEAIEKAGINVQYK